MRDWGYLYMKYRRRPVEKLAKLRERCPNVEFKIVPYRSQQGTSYKIWCRDRSRP